MVERMVAKKCAVRDLIQGDYVVKEGVTPSHILTPRGEVSRANLIAAVVGKPAASTILVDDGSGTLMARSFERQDLFGNIMVGDIVLLIGRPRKYEGRPFLAAEIARRLGTPKWLELRQAELGAGKEGSSAGKAVKRADPARPAPKAAERPVVTEEKREEVAPLSQEMVLALIRKLDAGQGAPMEEVVSAAGRPEAGAILTSLMAEGEIFEIRPGRVKVLE